MTTSHFDAIQWVVVGLTALLIVEGLMRVSSSRGLIDRIFPYEHLATRLLGALFWFAAAGLLFYSVWRR